MLTQLTFESSHFPHAEFERALAQALLVRITTILRDPTTGNWRTEGQAMEQDLAHLLTEPGLASADPAYAQGLQDAVGWWRYHLEAIQDWNIGAQVASPGFSDSIQELGGLRMGLLAYYQHTFIEASWATGTHEGDRAWARCEAALWQDEGAPHFLNYNLHVPGSVQPNTGSPNDPRWKLVIHFEDTDADGSMDTSWGEGIRGCGDVRSTCTEPFTDLDSDGHLLTFLRYLFDSRYIGIGGY